MVWMKTTGMVWKALTERLVKYNVGDDFFVTNLLRTWYPEGAANSILIKVNRRSSY